MKISLVTPAYYLANEVLIRGLVVGIPGFEPTPIGQLTGLRSVDVRGVTGVRMYELPPRLDSMETDIEYGARVITEVVAGITQVINGTLDAVFIDDEKDLELYRQLVGWNDVVV